jgi:hypothetical protein
MRTRILARYAKAIVGTTIELLEAAHASLEEHIHKERYAAARLQAEKASSGSREYFGYEATYGVRDRDGRLKLVKPDTGLTAEPISINVTCPSCGITCVSSPGSMGECHTCGASLGLKSGA